MTINAKASPVEDYTTLALYRQAMEYRPVDGFARFVCDTWPYGAVDLGHAWARWLGLDLADFRHYPPAPVPGEGTCSLCKEHIPDGQALAALGGRDGNNYAITLHKHCAAAIRRVNNWI